MQNSAFYFLARAASHFEKVGRGLFDLVENKT